MSTFNSLSSYSSSIALIGFGLGCLISALIRSWRQALLSILDSVYRLAGSLKGNIPVEERAFREEPILLVFIILGSLFVLLGTAGIVWTFYFVSA